MVLLIFFFNEYIYEINVMFKIYTLNYKKIYPKLDDLFSDKFLAKPLHVAICWEDWRIGVKG